MSFWDEHAKAEATLAPPAEPIIQATPTACAFCPHVGPDVLIGVCDGCAP